MRYRHTIFLLLILTCAAIQGNSQAYGDEWIDYNKQYFKVTLSQDGIYRLSYADLTNAGVPINTIDPRRLQLFYKGNEQAIFVQGQGDAVFNTTDYIEFYGKRNDGTADARLYRPVEAQPHQLYSLYSDSSAYFLTWNLTPTNGKRMASYSENNTGGLSPASSHNQEVRLLNVGTYSPGQGFSTEEFTKFSYFDYAEGWTSPFIQENQSIDFVLTGIVNGVQPDGVPNLEVLLLGVDNLSHDVAVEVGQNVASLRSLGTVQFNNFEKSVFTSPLQWADISAGGNITVRVTALGVSGGNDRISIPYVRLFYPQTFNMQSAATKAFRLKSNPVNKTYLEISNAASSTQLYDITDVDNVIRVGSNVNGSGISAIVNGTISERKLYANASAFITPVIKKAHFRSINAASHDYIIISHKLLMQPASGSSNPVKSYAGYRASTAGGGYDTLVVDMDMLYNQYNYGLKGPLAIFDFMRYLVDNGDPKFLFIIGKGLDPSVNFHRNPNGFINVTKLGVTHQIRDLVPSAGNPGSDMIFTAGLNGTTYEPAVPVGRLPALTSAQVMAYLNKVMESEAQPFDDLWHKNLLHLSGGISASELVNFRSFMDGFGAIAEDVHLGGKVQTIAKTSGSTVELINVADEVNKGVSLVTFYGHSAPSITDIDIGFVTDPIFGYNNVGKYPMFLINGCNAGQFFKADILFGEDWILAPNKGAIGFIAHSSFGFANNLKRYSDIFYEVGYGDSIFISKPVAQVQQEVAKRFISVSSASPNNVTQVRQMVLLGDPAVKLFGPELPDYGITDNDVTVDSFNSDPVTAESDSFAINIIVRNYGRTRSDSIKVAVSRTLSDNAVIVYDSIYPSVKYLDTLVFTIHKGTENGFGNNRFAIQLDSDFTIPELNENNNNAIIDFFIPLFGTKNIYPNDFAIVSEQPVEFLTQATNLLEGTREFLLEIDTVKTFNSPFKKQQTSSAKLLVSWTINLLPDISANDSTVYFWRTKFAQINEGESDEWVVSSFIYIKDSPEGWSQSVFTQMDENNLSGLNRNETKQNFDYLRTYRSLDITNFGGDNPANNTDVSVRIDNIEYMISNGFLCRDNTVNLIAFDKNTAVPYSVFYPIFSDPKTCGRQPQVINSFRFNELETGGDDIIKYIDNVNEGDTVVLFTIGDPQIANWSATVRSKLEEIGALTSNLAALQNGEPYILVGKKGAPAGAATEIKTNISPETEQQLQLNTTFSGVFSSGSMSSTIIGPASQWGSVVALANVSESPVTDQYSYDIIGVSSSGEETPLFNAVNTFPIDLSTVEASSYPYLKLNFKNSDDVNLTPPQLNRWQVFYEPVAEGIVIADEESVLKAKVQEGQIVERTYGFKNISKKQFSDSLSVKQILNNVDNRRTTINEFKIMKPAPGDTTKFKVTINSRNNVGLNDLNITVNPRIEPELIYENNTLDLRGLIDVERDNRNPVLDVLFDGRYILNGDIVSPTPLITIRLRDENPFIANTDTTGMNIFIKQECETCSFKRVPFSSNQIQWTPSTNKKEDFRVDYKPEKLEDGRYTLRVEASDVSGNPSGTEPYLISFEIINESTITNFYPYPNPFSTSTRFVFTLTGSEIPQEIKIQIMTVSGKIVREITQNELGTIRIGNNMSDFAWNGHDEFGDQLANGVYLYKVIVKQNGERLKQRGTSADKAFTKGFGKLYILR
ncbi:MAG TPA: C25 family cysteine peptidase [Fulvivirga sp.]|nr:C25 family cysteine peptidase [Fulvivirga sp.]